MKQAMIFAAGLGTRLKPITDTRPKALVEVDGTPMLQHVILQLKANGFERVVINVHHFAQQIIDFVHAHNDFGMEIRFSEEQNRLLDTGGGIKKAVPLFDDSSPVLIHNVDILSNVCLKELYEKTGTDDALLLVSRRETSRYLLFTQDMRLAGWTNTRTGEVKTPYDRQRLADCKPFAFAGIHVLSPRVFPLMKAWEERFSIIDFYLRHCKECSFKGHNMEGLAILDIGKPDALRQAELFIHENKVRKT